LALSAPLAIAFVKHLGDVYLPLQLDTSQFPSLEQVAAIPSEDEIIGRDMKEKFRKLCVAFVEALTRKEGKEHVVSLPLSLNQVIHVTESIG
jgi:regulator of nonsense transcripts 2